jgi:hypothetical protein
MKPNIEILREIYYSIQQNKGGLSYPALEFLGYFDA